MEKSGAETQDFLNVESFVQLRFTPLPPPKKNPIRLFGKEFGGIDPPTTVTSSGEPCSAVNRHETKKTGQNRRKFECHYCRRGFHTSQALGGHQNAHRRERLHAKRTHIHRISANEQLYGIVNHHYHHHTNCMVDNSITGSRDQTRVIAGRPFAGWRFPTAVQNSTAFNGGGLLNLNSSGGSSPVMYVHESNPRFYDQLSLDLHL